LNCRVQPGVLLVLASLRFPAMALMPLDFPALERPAKATSRPVSGGPCGNVLAPLRNTAPCKARRHCAGRVSGALRGWCECLLACIMWGLVFDGPAHWNLPMPGMISLQ
jgi:hypothetical protein